MTSITIPHSVKEIGMEAFNGCKGLTSITIPDSVKKIGERAFSYCTGLTSITIPDSVTEIGDGAFSGCNALISTHIPFKLFSTSDRPKAALGFTEMLNKGEIFSEESLKENRKYIKSNRKELYWLAFKHPVLLKYMTDNKILSIDDTDELINRTDIDTSARTVLMEYRETAFSHKQKVSKFEKDLGLRELTTAELKKLWSTTKPDNGTLLIKKYKGIETTVVIPQMIDKSIVAEIGRWAFKGCTGLTSITIPDSVTKIGDYAFFGCKGLTSITLPDSVTEIGDWAFSDCKGLKSITIPDSVTEIGEEAFKDCTGLTSITIPDCVTEIGGWAFKGCTGLTSITIPDSVKKIGEEAFSGCDNLTIHAPQGSFAEKYAKELNIDFAAE